MDSVYSSLGGGIAWSEDDKIVYAGLEGEADPAVAIFNQVQRLFMVPAGGGTPSQIGTVSEEPNAILAHPDPLPGGSHVLFSSYPGNDNTRASNGYIAVLSLETGESRRLIDNAYHPRYVPTGHIVFMRSESLWAVPFDIETLEIAGDETPVIDGVQTNTANGMAVFAFSDDGLLVYLPGRNTLSEASTDTLVWVDREGNEEPINAPPAAYRNLSLSPDGTQILYTATDINGNTDIWLQDIDGVPVRRTFDAVADDFPTWLRDGTRFVFWSERNGGGLYIQAADGGTDPELLIAAPDGTVLVPTSGTPHGSLIYFNQGGISAGRSDLFEIAVDGDRTPETVLGTIFDEDGAQVSPDGQWIAYVSDETNFDEVYVRRLDDFDGGLIKVSASGGYAPRWRADSRELYYRDQETMMAVSITPGDTFDFEDPVELFSGLYSADGRSPYDVEPGGQRFAMINEPRSEHEIAGQTVLVVVENWFEELKRLAPPTSRFNVRFWPKAVVT